MKYLWIGFAEVALWATPSSAQESLRSTLVGIEAGDPVRVTYHTPHGEKDHRATLTGQYASLDAAGLRLWISEPGGIAARAIERQDLFRVERERRRGSGAGAVVGMSMRGTTWEEIPLPVHQKALSIP